MLLYVDNRSEIQSKQQTGSDGHCYSAKHTAHTSTEIPQQTHRYIRDKNV